MGIIPSVRSYLYALASVLLFAVTVYAEDDAAVFYATGELQIPCVEITASFYEIGSKFNGNAFTIDDVLEIDGKSQWCGFYEGTIRKLYLPVVKADKEYLWAVFDVKTEDGVTLVLDDYGISFMNVIVNMDEVDKKCYESYQLLTDEVDIIDDFTATLIVAQAEQYQENAFCQAALAYAHALERGVPADEEIPGCDELKGTIYAQLNGCDEGPDNPSTAFQLASSSAESGNVLGQYVFGMLYDMGIGTPMLKDRAFEFYLLSAESDYVLAEKTIGQIYEKGQRVSVDYIEAFKWYMLSAMQNDVWGIYNVGRMYERGLAVKQDNDTACKWYLLTAEHGYSNGLYKAGWCYENGFFVEKDYQAAYEWYLEASYLNNSSAQYSIGSMYEKGRGVWQSNEASCSWYTLALENGDSSAQFAMDRVCP